MSDARHTAFDPNGKFVYFLASTDNGPSSAGIDLSSLDRATTSSPYVIVLKKYGVSPVPPESDDEKGKDEKKDDDKKSDDKDDKKDDGKLADKAAKDKEAKDKDTKDDKKEDKKEDKPVEVKIDLEGIRQPHPVAARSSPELHRPSGRQDGSYLSRRRTSGRSPLQRRRPGNSLAMALHHREARHRRTPSQHRWLHRLLQRR